MVPGALIGAVVSAVVFLVAYALELGSLLSTGLAVVSIATLTGLGLLRGTVTNLREQLGDARGEIKSLKDGREEMRGENAELRAEVGALRRIVTGEVHWVALDEKLDEHHTEATTHWTKAEGLLEEIRDELRRS